MGFNYKPQSFTKANKGAIKKYEASLKDLEQYIHNLITSHDYLQQQVEIDKNEFAHTFGLVTDFDICSGIEIDVARHTESFLKSYIDEVIKRAYLMGVCSGDTKGTAWVKERMTKASSLGGKRKSKSAEARDKYFYDLVKKEVEKNGLPILESPPRYFRLKASKNFGVAERSLNQSINKAIKLIKNGK